MPESPFSSSETSRKEGMTFLDCAMVGGDGLEPPTLSV